MTVPAADEPVGLSALARFDGAVDAKVSRVPRSLRPAMQFATAVGYPGVQAVPLVLLAVLWGGVAGTAALIIAVSLALPRVIKHSIRRRRPESEYVAAMRMAGPSFPSGHAFAAVVAFGFYAYLAVTRMSTAAAVLVALGCLFWVVWVSASRLFFRAHYASDIVGGWVIAAVVLAVVLVVMQP